MKTQFKWIKDGETQTIVSTNKTPESDNQRNETRAGREERIQIGTNVAIVGKQFEVHGKLVDTLDEALAIERKVRLDARAAAPAQAQHSPLPWKVSDSKPPKIIIAGRPGFIATLGYPEEGNREANAAFIVRACNNAQHLADALACLLGAYGDLEAGNTITAFRTLADAREALAEWSNQQ